MVTIAPVLESELGISDLEWSIGAVLHVGHELVWGDEGFALVRALEFDLERGGELVLPYRGAPVGAGVVVLLPGISAILTVTGFACVALDGIHLDVETNVAEMGLFVELRSGVEELVKLEFFLHWGVVVGEIIIGKGECL